MEGAALATVFGTVVACGMSVASLFRKESFVSLPYILRNRIRFRRSNLASIANIGSNIFLEQLLLRVGFMSTAVMTAKLGTDAFAAHQVGMNIMSLSFSFGDGMQVAAVALIGRSLGEEKPDMARLYGLICQRMGNAASLVLSAFYLLCGGFLFRLYFREPHIVSMGVMIMRIMVLIVIMQIAQVIYMGCLRGAGDVRFTTITSTFSVTFVRTISSYVLCYGLGLGLMGIWLGIFSDQLCRFVLTQWRFRSGVWTRVKI